MKDLEFRYDMERKLFVHEPTGFMMDAEYVMIEDDDNLKHVVRKNTGAELDDFLLMVLRDTVETCTPTFPFGN